MPQLTLTRSNYFSKLFLFWQVTRTDLLHVSSFCCWRDALLRPGVLRLFDVHRRREGGVLGPDVEPPAHSHHHSSLSPDVLQRSQADVSLPGPTPPPPGGHLQLVLCRAQPLHLHGDPGDQQADPVQLDLSAGRLQLGPGLCQDRQGSVVVLHQ